MVLSRALPILSVMPDTRDDRDDRDLLADQASGIEQQLIELVNARHELWAAGRESPNLDAEIEALQAQLGEIAERLAKV